MLDTYEKESKMTGLNFRTWIETKYDPNKLPKYTEDNYVSFKFYEK